MAISFIEYQNIVEQAPIMIWRSDVNAECDYFNEKWLDFTGRTMEQELGNGWSEGVHPDDLEMCLKIYLAAFKNREIFEIEYRLRRHDGTYRWVFDRGVPFNDSDGNFAGYIGSAIELQQLRGVLPICSSCKAIRDDQGDWNRIETYISMHSGAMFSHGLCPACATKLYPDVYRKNE